VESIPEEELCRSQADAEDAKSGKASLALALASVLAATAVIVWSGVAAASGSAPPYGNGLKLTSKVLGVAQVARSVGPWLRWNSKTCSYQATTAHPAAYKPAIRKIASTTQIGYMDYGDTDPFGIANSTSVKAEAARGRLQAERLQLQYPSKTVPIDDAKLSVLRHDRGVLQGNLDPSLLPSFFRILEGQGCIPSIALYGGSAILGLRSGRSTPTPAPCRGSTWGSRQRSGAGTRRKTAFVQCTDPTLSPFIAAMFPAAAKAVTAAGLRCRRRTSSS